MNISHTLDDFSLMRCISDVFWKEIDFHETKEKPGFLKLTGTRLMASYLTDWCWMCWRERKFQDVRGCVSVSFSFFLSFSSYGLYPLRASSASCVSCRRIHHLNLLPHRYLLVFLLLLRKRFLVLASHYSSCVSCVSASFSVEPQKLFDTVPVTRWEKHFRQIAPIKCFLRLYLPGLDATWILQVEHCWGKPILFLQWEVFQLWNVENCYQCYREYQSVQVSSEGTMKGNLWTFSRWTCCMSVPNCSEPSNLWTQLNRHLLLYSNENHN